MPKKTIEAFLTGVWWRHFASFPSHQPPITNHFDCVFALFLALFQAKCRARGRASGISAAFRPVCRRCLPAQHCEQSP